MPDPGDFHALFRQLQTRYPSCSLVTELVQHQDGYFVVRALVHLGSALLVTSMASAATVEQAEDHARLRVLALLGITPIASSAAQHIFSSGLTLTPQPLAPAADPESLSSSPLSGIVASPNSVSPELIQRSQPTPDVLRSPEKMPSGTTVVDPIAAKLPEKMPSGTTVADLVDPVDPTVAAELPSLAELAAIPQDFDAADDPIPAPPKRRSTRPIAPYESDSKGTGFYGAIVEEPLLDIPVASSREPIDLSELIALSDVEMERVGWNKKRGQTHLRQTYSKQTRAELDEDQLLEFLHYLRALPSKH
jgi:hypothetical protein